MAPVYGVLNTNTLAGHAPADPFGWAVLAAFIVFLLLCGAADRFGLRRLTWTAFRQARLVRALAAVPPGFDANRAARRHGSWG